jgi:hypothetical protein
MRAITFEMSFPRLVAARLAGLIHPRGFVARFVFAM